MDGRWRWAFPFSAFILPKVNLESVMGQIDFNLNLDVDVDLNVNVNLNLDLDYFDDNKDNI